MTPPVYGCVKMVNLEKNFGFIKPEDGTADIHFRPKEGSGSAPKRGDRIVVQTTASRGRRTAWWWQNADEYDRLRVQYPAGVYVRRAEAEGWIEYVPVRVAGKVPNEWTTTSSILPVRLRHMVFVEGLQDYLEHCRQRLMVLPGRIAACQKQCEDLEGIQVGDISLETDTDGNGHLVVGGIQLEVRAGRLTVGEAVSIPYGNYMDSDDDSSGIATGFGLIGGQRVAEMDAIVRLVARAAQSFALTAEADSGQQGVVPVDRIKRWAQRDLDALRADLLRQKETLELLAAEFREELARLERVNK